MSKQARQLIFIGAGLLFAVLVLLLPAGSLSKNFAALVLAAIAILAFYPVSNR